MPSLLAIETSANVGAVCVLIDGVATNETVRNETKLSAWLLPAIDRALARAGVTLAEIDAVAYGQGPGAFTGLRTACATAQAIAYARAKPLYPVSSMEAFACSALNIYAPINKAIEEIYVIFDARMNEAFCANFIGRSAQELVLIRPMSLVPLSTLHLTNDERVVGSGAVLIARRDCADPERLEALQSLTIAAEDRWAEGVARIAALAIARGESGIDPRDAQPEYVRNNVAKTEVERTREATHV
jgi:tRNA threonylcarbamoyladenosine biosynthesis protein TsaB